MILQLVKRQKVQVLVSGKPASPNDYTPTDEVQTSGGDEGNLDLYGLTREVLRLKKQNAKQAAQILRLKTKIKILVKKVKPVIAEYSSFVKIKATLSKKKKLKKAHKKKSSSFKQGRKKVSDGSTGLNEVDVNSGDSQMMDVDDTISAEVHEGTAEVHEGTAQVNEGTAEVNESTAGANLSTEPSMKEVEDEAGPLSPFMMSLMSSIQDDTLIADFLNKNYEEVKVIYEKVKKYNETFTAIGTPEDEEAIKEMNEKRAGIRRAQSTSEELPKESTVNKETDSTLPDEGSKKRRASSRLKQIARKKRAKTEDVEELRKSLKIVDFLSDSLTDEEILSTRSQIVSWKVVQSPGEDFIVVERANGFVRHFTYIHEVLHIFDRHDLHDLYELVISQGSTKLLSQILFKDLRDIMGEINEDFWASQSQWEIVRWRLYESSRVHIVEFEDQTEILMRVDQRYPLTREFMERMLEHGLEVQEETESALNVLRVEMVINSPWEQTLAESQELTNPELMATDGLENLMLRRHNLFETDIQGIYIQEIQADWMQDHCVEEKTDDKRKRKRLELKRLKDQRSSNTSSY
ncbi:hypothetical protein Tco_0701273 [Tanacetum coccineum]